MSDPRILMPDILAGSPLFSVTELIVSKLSVSKNDVVVIWLPEDTPVEIVTQIGAAIANVIGDRFAHIVARRGYMDIEVLEKEKVMDLRYIDNEPAEASAVTDVDILEEHLDSFKKQVIKEMAEELDRRIMAGSGLSEPVDIDNEPAEAIAVPDVKSLRPEISDADMLHYQREIDDATAAGKRFMVTRGGDIKLEVDDAATVAANRLPDLICKRSHIKLSDLSCSRERSEMTPCIARDGETALTVGGCCVGCGESAISLLEKVQELEADDE